MAVSSKLHNVKVSVLSDSFDEKLGMSVYGLPIKTNLLMTFVDTYFTQEGTRQGVHERDTPVRYRFIHRINSLVDVVPETGMALRIDYVKHPISKTWVRPRPTSKVYVIKYVAETTPGSNIFDIGASLQGEE
jgi:hypothetical protein